MENQNTNQPIQNAGFQQPLPNSTAVLVLGILSIVMCWCYGIIGIVLGIIAVVLSQNAKKLYVQNPGAYTEGSYKNMNAGRICGIIGLSLSALYMVFLICWIAIWGAAFSTLPWQMMNQ